MKLAIQCESPLLQQSLELFLVGHLTSLKQAQLIIRDTKTDDDTNALWISADENADVQKPFSRSQLMLAIEAKLRTNETVSSYQDMIDTEITEVEEVVASEPLSEIASTSTEVPDYELLERRIAMLTREYQENIMKAVRAFYG